MELTHRLTHVRHVLAASIAASLLLLAAHQAQAGLADNPPSMKVRFGDLNLEKEAGIEELYRRIRVAAGTVCDKAMTYTLIRRQWWRCYRDTIGNAVAQINNSRLTAMHVQWTERKKLG